MDLIKNLKDILGQNSNGRLDLHECMVIRETIERLKDLARLEDTVRDEVLGQFVVVAGSYEGDGEENCKVITEAMPLKLAVQELETVRSYSWSRIEQAPKGLDLHVALMEAADEALSEHRESFDPLRIQLNKAVKSAKEQPK